MSTRSCIHHHLTHSKSVRRWPLSTLRPMLTPCRLSAASNHSLHQRPLSPLKFARPGRPAARVVRRRHCCCSVCAAVRLPGRAVLQLTFVRDEAEDMIQTSLRKALLVGPVLVRGGVLASSPVHNGVAGWSHTALLLRPRQRAVPGPVYSTPGPLCIFVSNHARLTAARRVRAKAVSQCSVRRARMSVASRC